MLSQGDFLGLVTIYAYVIGIIIVTMFMERRGLGKDRRKFVHIMIGNFIFLWWLFDSWEIIVGIIILPVLLVLILASSKGTRKMQETVVGRTSNQGHEFGLVYYVLSLAILVSLFFDHLIIAAVGVIAMAYGDGMAGFVGKRWGKIRIWKGKSLEGTLAAFIATSTMIYITLRFYGFLADNGWYAFEPVPALTISVVSLAIGVFVAVVEIISPGRFDNLIIPLSAAGAMALLGF
jgi:phytol kinase